LRNRTKIENYEHVRCVADLIRIREKRRAGATVSEKQNKKELSDTSGVAENPKKKNYEARDNHIKKKYGDTVDLLGKRRQEGPVHL